MGNRIFQSILNEKIENFRLAFEKTSKELFWDEKEKKLIHPGEFGTYREDICKDFLRILTPHKLKISSGFLINNFEEISTQCDIIIHDYKNTPLIENSRNQRFFPVETTVGIGEIKSTLSKNNFKIAINKLARNKIIREKIKTPVPIKNTSNSGFSPSTHPYDGIFSFLICKKLDFDIKDLCSEISSFYDSNIQPRQKHNLILSIEDGLYLYGEDNNKKALQFPIFKKKILKDIYIEPGDNNLHFNYFSSYFFMAMSSIRLYYPEITDYINEWGINVNKKNI